MLARAGLWGAARSSPARWPPAAHAPRPLAKRRTAARLMFPGHGTALPVSPQGRAFPRLCGPQPLRLGHQLLSPAGLAALLPHGAQGTPRWPCGPRTSCASSAPGPCSALLLGGRQCRAEPAPPLLSPHSAHPSTQQHPGATAVPRPAGCPWSGGKSHAGVQRGAHWKTPLEGFPVLAVGQLLAVPSAPAPCPDPHPLPGAVVCSECAGAARLAQCNSLCVVYGAVPLWCQSWPGQQECV